MIMSSRLWKKSLAVVAAVLVSLPSLCRAEGGTASTNITCIVPPSGIQAAAAWATGTTYPQGAIVEAANGVYLMCLVAGGGTSTNAPYAGAVLADGYRWTPARSLKRTGLIVENTSASGTLYVSESAQMTVSNAMALTAYGSVSFPTTAPGGRLYAMTSTGTVTWATFEW